VGGWPWPASLRAGEQGGRGPNWRDVLGWASQQLLRLNSPNQLQGGGLVCVCHNTHTTVGWGARKKKRRGDDPDEMVLNDPSGNTDQGV